MKNVIYEPSNAIRNFILHWGEMATRWGINRTEAQIFALLYMAPNALNAEEITHILSVARSNVSTSIRSLLNWRIIKVVHVMGDRRDHYEALEDVWEVFRIVVEERKRRELDPTLDILQGTLTRDGESLTTQERNKLKNMLEFFETTADLHQQMNSMNAAALRKMAHSLKKARSLLNFLKP